MDKLPRARSSSRSRFLFLSLAVVVIFVVAGATAVLMWRGDEPAEGPRAASPVVPLAGHDVCADRIVINVSTDAEMRRIAKVVRDDQRARKVYTETKHQAFQRFQQVFKDRPEMLEIARPEALPASVTVVGKAPLDLRVWAGELARTFPDATSVEPMIMSEILPSLAARYGRADIKPSCPPNGERS